MKDPDRNFMFCGECGIENPDTNQFCKNCGKPLKKHTVQQIPAGYPTPAAAAPPISPPAGFVSAQVPLQPAPPGGFMGTLRRRKAMVASIIFGVASALILPYIFGALAIILGIWAVYKKDKLGVIGIIIGSLVIVVDYFYLVIFP
jgi:hypothetical protein